MFDPSQMATQLQGLASGVQGLGSNIGGQAGDFRNQMTNWMGQMPQYTQGMDPMQFRTGVQNWMGTRPQFGGIQGPGTSVPPVSGQPGGLLTQNMGKIPSLFGNIGNGKLGG